PAQGEAVEVDDVEVGLPARGQHPPVGEANGPGGGPGLALDQPLDGEPALRAPDTPVGQQEGRESAVADRADVGTTVGQAGDGVGVDQHLPGLVEVAGDVVGEREVEQAVPAV